MSVGGRPLRVISMVVDGVFSTVLDSQVAVPLNLMGEVAPQVQRALLVLTSFRHRRNPRLAARQAAIREALPGVSVVFGFRAMLGLPLEHRFWARSLAKALRHCGFDGPGPIVVHCRGEPAGSAAAVLKRRDPRVRILLDLRGAAMDEVGLNTRGPAAWVSRKLCRQKLQLSLAEADAINAVSGRLIAHVRESEGFARELPVSTVGCCADPKRFYFDPAERERRRAELGLSPDRFVVCYCGSMVPYQRPDVVARTFARILSGMPDAHLLVVSGEGQVLVDHLAALGVGSDHVTVRAAKHSAVASYLMAADTGLLLREDNLTNRVASPVKFAEYLRCGLPVLLTPHIGDISDWAVETGVGQIAAFDAPAEEAVTAARAIRARLAAEGEALRRRCSELAERQFSWEWQLPRIVQMYEAIAR